MYSVITLVSVVVAYRPQAGVIIIQTHSKIETSYRLFKLHIDIHVHVTKCNMLFPLSNLCLP